MRVLTRMAEAMGATALLDIESAHIDSCLYHGPAGLDFANRLVDGGGRVVVPTTLNVSSLDLLHPDLYRGDAETAQQARALMVAYEQLGCRPTWTCAPYQREQRPSAGTHVAWAESNAIVFVNSVLGARSNRYGDFIDICAAITGRAPAAGLHLDEHRRATAVIDITHIDAELIGESDFATVLGYWLGAQVDHEVAVVDGLPRAVTEDQLKQLGSAAASSGAVALFHVAGVTPEASTVNEALGGRRPGRVLRPTVEELRRTRARLTTATAGALLGAVSLGTPHYSVAEFVELVALFAGRRVSGSVDFYVSTGRSVLNELALRGLLDPLESAGVTIVTDTCTYITPVMGPITGVAMTDSGKWANYAPGNLGIDVVFAATPDCVESAIAGTVVRSPGPWDI